MRAPAIRWRQQWVAGLAAALAGLAVASAATAPAALDPAAEKSVRGFLSTYCQECHGPEKQKADRRFDRLRLSIDSPDSLHELQEMIDMLNLGDMPPEDAKRRPGAAEVRQQVARLTELVAEGQARLASTGGRTVLRRLNRREYINTVGDLFGLNMALFNPTANFPRDEMVEQLDNVGDTLRTSGFLLAQYLDAGEQVVEKTFEQLERPCENLWRFDGNFRDQMGGYVGAKVSYSRYMFLEQTVSSVDHRGGYGFLWRFDQGVPADGWYDIRVKAEALNRINPYDPGFIGRDPAMPFRMGIVPGNIRAGSLQGPQPIEPCLGEVVVKDNEVAWYNFRVWLDRGFTPRFTFLNGTFRVQNAVGKLIKAYRDTLPPDLPRRQVSDSHVAMQRHGQMPRIRIHEIEIRGPLIEQWPPAGRQKIMGDAPLVPERFREILKNFADRAYRRPARTEEVDRLVKIANERMKEGDSELAALKESFKAVLCSPAFIYLDEPAAVASVERSLTPHALASRLSYFIWSTMPDAELRRLADSGELLQPKVLLGQLRRMLASPRADTFVASFLDSWLNLRTLGDMMPAMDAFAQVYAENLLPAMKQETRLFARDLLDRNDSVVRFLNADYTFLNRPLARLYGMADAVDPETGHEFRRVKLTTAQRGGLLGQASVLTVSANGIETSPVIRGVWVLKNLLGTPPAPPPDDVPAIDPDVRGALSIKEILAKHRNTPACYDCHRKIDPLGFALENFNAIGGWRAHYDKGVAIETAGELPGGRKFEDLPGLKKILAERKDVFVRALTDRLLSYACGRRMESLDRPAIDRILKETAAEDYRFRDLIEHVVLSRPFRSK